MLTIGKLAKQVNVRTSTLRYYEKEGLLEPNGRSEAGYRLYAPEAVQKVQLIQRAQRLGFSLADIRPLLTGWESGDLSDEALISTAEHRYLALEKQLTKMLILQHELELFLQDLNQRSQEPAAQAHDAFDDLLDQVCADPTIRSSANFTYDWLISQNECSLSSDAGRRTLDRLRGQHVHIWQEDEDDYHILVVSDDAAVAAALQELTRLESECEAHPEFSPQFAYDDEGYLFVARGENAFIFARLFLALEQESPHNH